MQRTTETRQRLYEKSIEVAEYDSDPEAERIRKNEQDAQDLADELMADSPHWSEQV